jgi:hypothetical protein
MEFHVLLTVHFGIIFVNNQLDAQFFFMYVYFYSLHVSGSHVPIVRRINYIIMEPHYVFFFSLQIRLKFFPFKEELNEMFSRVHFCLQVKYPLLSLGFMKLEYSRQIVKKYTNVKFNENSAVVS